MDEAKRDIAPFSGVERCGWLYAEISLFVADPLCRSHQNARPSSGIDQKHQLWWRGLSVDFVGAASTVIVPKWRNCYRDREDHKVKPHKVNLVSG